MALPGLGLVAPTASSSAAPISPALSAPTVHSLDAESEWRFDVGPGSTIDVKILSGTAEIFGTELAVNHTYTFKSTKACIFTWHGCRIEVTGSCQEYTTEPKQTPMVQYFNVHFALENARKAAIARGETGPSVLVVGPNDSGKTSLVKMLTAYATRMGRQPLVINTDNREGLLSIPGALTATTFASAMDVEEGWGSSPTSGPSPVPVKLPLCYYYGLANVEDNPKLYKPILSRLALAATSRLAEDPEVKKSGMIIDTPGIISQGKNSYDLLSHIVSEFSVSIILTLGSEKLQADLNRRFSTQRSTGTDQPITVLRLDKSGGCETRDEEFMSSLRNLQIREYFFGDAKRTLSPTTLSIDFSQLAIYQIRESSAMMASFLPGSDDPEAEPTGFAGQIYDRIPPSGMMLHAVLAIMHAAANDGQEAIRDASVMGFVYVAEVDEKKKKVKLLSPVGGRVGERPLVWGTWPEGVGSLLG